MECHSLRLSLRWSIACKTLKSFHPTQCQSKNRSLQNLSSLWCGLHWGAWKRLPCQKWTLAECPTTIDCICSSRTSAQKPLHSDSEGLTRRVWRFAWTDRCRTLLSALPVFWSADSKPRTLQQWRHRPLGAGCLRSDLLLSRTIDTRIEEAIATTAGWASTSP